FTVASLCLGGLLLAALPAAAGPFISEFMADNVATLADEDGDHSDWIEISNPGVEAMDLGGWYLTDDVTKLTKWQFPVSTSLGEGESVVVFASGKDRASATGEFHTNFALDRNGEFLALVMPDGMTITSRHAPFPPQEADHSYGFGWGPSAVTTVLIDADAPARALIPGGPVSDDWRGGGPFDDTAWTEVHLGVGFNTEGGAVIGG
ncbi:MAG: lamin tail domain-containing protein, partial [Akkermansiaceae bacterium]|nr:lamin tail domain-containing protein [Akkermansiaceae bacterium]